MVASCPAPGTRFRRAYRTARCWLTFVRRTPVVGHSICRQVPLTLLVVVVTLVTSSIVTSHPTAQAQAEQDQRPAVLERFSAFVRSPHCAGRLSSARDPRKPPGEGPFRGSADPARAWRTSPSELLRRYAVTGLLASRFLAAGYVVATMTCAAGTSIRSLESRSMIRSRRSTTCRSSVRQRGQRQSLRCSGGDLALAVAAEKPVAAMVSEEPASVLFTALLDETLPKTGERTPAAPRRCSRMSSGPVRWQVSDGPVQVGEDSVAGLIVQGDVGAPLA